MSSATLPPSPPPFDDELVDRALAQEESFRFDCKRVKKDLTKILETVVAFANSEGGTIALGLEDPDKAKGRARVIGVQENPTNWDELRRLMGSRITESESLPRSWHEVGCTLGDGSIGSIVFLRIGKSSRVHSIVDDGTWVRFDKSNKELTAPEINNLSFARGTISAETQLETVDFELLDTDYWRAYARQRRLTRSIEEAMFHVGLARKDREGTLRPTRAAVLLFAEDPSGLLAGKAAIRIFHYRGTKMETDPNTNLIKRPITAEGPLISQIQAAKDAVVNELASGIQMGPLGFEIVQKYPLRVINEAITNAVIHRDYRLNADIHIRIFADRLEIESPGLLAGPVTVGNINRMGTHPRNPIITKHLRDFPLPPNLDAGEGVRMMFGTMREAGLYPPLYWSRPRIPREAVVIHLFNENRPSTWEQVSDYIDRRGEIGNAELRMLMDTDNPVRASRKLREWVSLGYLVVANPSAAKQFRKYTRPGGELEEPLFSWRPGNQEHQEP